MFLPRPRCGGRGRKEAAREEEVVKVVVMVVVERRMCGGGTGAQREEGKLREKRVDAAGDDSDWRENGENDDEVEGTTKKGTHKW